MTHPAVEFVSMEPQHPVVRGFVSHYYFHRSFSDDFYQELAFYPNYQHALTFYKGSDVRIDNHGSVVNPAAKTAFRMIYSINLDQALSVKLTGRFNKIGIVFRPLGMNRLLHRPISDFMHERLQLLDATESFATGVMASFEAICDENNLHKRVALLDEVLATVPHHALPPLLEQAVQLILDTGGTVRVDALATKLGASTKTLLRLFRKHLLCSVLEYKQLVRFRNALNDSMRQGASVRTKLTDLALRNGYYDQADFIRQFREITGMPPTKLLRKLDRWGNHGIYWQER